MCPKICFVATWSMSHLHAFCCESHFVANERCFGFVLSRLLLINFGFDSDFAQISHLAREDVFLKILQCPDFEFFGDT